MRDVFRIAAGVAVGVGLLVLAGSGRDTPPRAALVVEADDVEAPVPAEVVPAATVAPPPAATSPLAPALPAARAGWQAGAHAPGAVVPSMVVRAARRRPELKACTPAEAEGPEGVACDAPPARHAVEIQWNAPGSTP